PAATLAIAAAISRQRSTADRLHAGLGQSERRRVLSRRGGGRGATPSTRPAAHTVHRASAHATANSAPRGLRAALAPAAPQRGAGPSRRHWHVGTGTRGGGPPTDEADGVRSAREHDPPR